MVSPFLISLAWNTEGLQGSVSDPLLSSIDIQALDNLQQFPVFHLYATYI